MPRRRRPGYTVADRRLGRDLLDGDARPRGRPLDAAARRLRRPRAVHDLRPGGAARPADLVRPAGRLLPPAHRGGARGRQGRAIASSTSGP